MASKPVTTLLIFLISLLVAHPALAHGSKKPKSAFGFLKHLEGCHKGDNVTGIHDLKNYLHHFGYLNYHKNQSHADDEEFDEMLEAAVKTYQLNYHLNTTGSLDHGTVAEMSMPRCGVPDIVNGTTRMRSSKKRSGQQHGGGSHVHTVSHYSFFQGNPRWPPSKYQLTYGFLPGFPTQAMDPVARAFQTWAASTHFRFTRVPDSRNADLRISFNRRDHQDGAPFDGRGGTIAHAFAPQNGRFHYDADEPWAVGAVRGAFDLETVALHEIGHLLGLGHSSVQGAIMFPSISTGATKGLHGDDIQGIRALYS